MFSLRRYRPPIRVSSSFSLSSPFFFVVRVYKYLFNDDKLEEAAERAIRLARSCMGGSSIVLCFVRIFPPVEQHRANNLHLALN